MFANTVRPPGREHTLGLPRALIAIRIIQLVLAVLILGLDAYGLYVLAFSGAALNMFTTVATIIVCIYNIVAELGPVSLYNYWAILALDIFLTVFWLISFALMAAQVAPLFTSYSYYSGYYSYYSYYSSYTYYGIAFMSCMAAVAGLGGLLFCLFGITLILTGIAIHRHRAAGGHCMPGRAATTAPAHASEKFAGVPPTTTMPVYASGPPAQGYGVPPQGYGAPPPTHQPVYGQAPVGYPPQQQPQQHFAHHPGQTMSPPPPAQHLYGTPTPPLAQPQPVYGVPPQASPSPISAQPTGGSFIAPQGPHHELPPQPMQGSPQQLAGTPVHQPPYQPPPQQ